MHDDIISDLIGTECRLQTITRVTSDLRDNGQIRENTKRIDHCPPQDTTMDTVTTTDQAFAIMLAINISGDNKK